MDERKVKVVVASHLEAEHVERIRALDPQHLEVMYREDLVPPPRWPGDHVGPEGWRRGAAEEEEFRAMIREAEVLYDFPRFPDGRPLPLPEVAPRLRWVQGSMAGAGEVAKAAGLLETDVTVTTASGVFSEPLAEFVLMALLQHVKNLDRLRRDKEARRWDESPVDTLAGKTLCLVGTGSIGRAVAEKARVFGMRVVGVKRSVRPDDEAYAFAGALYPTDGLHEALAGADYVVVTLPGTPQTRRLVDREAIAAMRPGAYFVNVGRGSVVDEGALVDALGDGRLSGAALDVFETEPLPEGSPLWELPNVIVSPHATDNVVGGLNALQADLFCENLRRYLAGEPLKNVLDKGLLY
jgi:phosphoglycerate dehydrogenase-like enzyme